MFEGVKRIMGLEASTETADRIADYRRKGSPTENFATAAADKLAAHDNATIRKTLPDIWHQSAGVIPTNPEQRWLAIAEAAEKAAARHIVHGRAVGLPAEVGIAARELSLDISGRLMHPGKPVAETMDRATETLTHRTRMALTIGPAFDRSLDHQAEALARNPEKAYERLLPLDRMGPEGLMPANDAERVKWVRDGLGREAAMARTGILGPRTIVQLAITPEAVDSRHNTAEFDALPHARPNHEQVASMGMQEKLALVASAMPGAETGQFARGPNIETRGPASESEYARRELEARKQRGQTAQTPSSQARTALQRAAIQSIVAGQRNSR